MKTPPLLIGATLVFWGWQTQIMYPAIIMCLVIEGAYLIKSRWDLSLSDFIRVSDLCTILLVCVVIFVLATKPREIILILVRWLPLILFPLVVAQRYSLVGKVDIKALFLLARKTGNTYQQNISINLALPYFVLCLISAGSANVREDSYYICLFLFFGWALSSVRSKRFSPATWFCLMAFAGLFGYAGHIGLNRLQAVVMNLGSDFFMHDTDPFQRMTAIGDIGELKLSNRVLFRISSGSKNPPSILLREASYNTYNASTWFATQAPFYNIHSVPDNTSWQIARPQSNSRAITVYSPLRRGKGMLKLPLGAFKIENFPAVIDLQKNRLGAVKIENGPGLITYQVNFHQQAVLDSPPNEADLVVPLKEKGAISEILKILNPESISPENILTSIKFFFRQNFTYSLKLDKGKSKHTPLSNFLIESRAGHCEYFATATVLLLRACGIPSRYASGYVAHEYSNLENKIVIRKRHAHAWVLAYINGNWRNFDTTPPSSIRIDEKRNSEFKIFTDLWAFLTFKGSLWRWSKKEGQLLKYAVWLLVPLLLIFGRRLHTRKIIKRIQPGQVSQTLTTSAQGTDSEFYLIEKKLNGLGFERSGSQTLYSWIRQIDTSGLSAPLYRVLKPILVLHYRYRFDRKMLTPEEKESMHRNVVEAIGTLDSILPRQENR